VTEAPDLFVTGERVGLGPLRRDLAATYARWLNSREVRHGLEHLGISTRETEEASVDEELKKGAEEEPKSAEFTIYDLSDGAPVGTAGLFDISHMHACGKFGILLGERRGQGLGTEATRLVLDWGFTTLNLRNVLLEVLAWNEPALRSYERAGFRRIGVRRAAVMSRGERVDVVLMDVVPGDLGA
jgi:RimJ/RimL family protein N-acetyltransferase